MRPIDHNGHVPDGTAPEPVANPADGLVAAAANALYEFGRLQGRLEAALERIAELEAKVKAQ